MHVTHLMMKLEQVNLFSKLRGMFAFAIYNKKTKETTYVKNIAIEDMGIENDTYYFDKVYGVPEVNTISDEGGSDKYSIKDTMFVSIKDNNGNDKYSFNGQIINTEIDDFSGIDTYSNNSNT